jgi:hypothetical protein
MAVMKLVWVGLFCCLSALAVQVFPDATFRAGIDVGAAWQVFGFGVFLIVMGAVLSLRGGAPNGSPD